MVNPTKKMIDPEKTAECDRQTQEQTRKGDPDMNTYEHQILNTCIQTFINLYGHMPEPKDLLEMLGERYRAFILPAAA